MDIKRHRLKKKVLDLAWQKGFPLEKLYEVLNFVFDYMVLPPKMEEELKAEVPIFQPIKKDTMARVYTKERLDILDAVTIHRTGMTYLENIEANVAAREAKMAAQEAELAAIKEATKEAAKKAVKETDCQTVHSMMKAGFSIEKIADILGKELSYISELATEKQG